MGVRGAARPHQTKTAHGKPVMNPYSYVPDSSPTPSTPTSPTSSPPQSLHPHHVPPPLRAAQLLANHHPATPQSARNLLISPVKSKPNRLRHNPRQQPPRNSSIPDSEDSFTVEFRVYPFPPSSKPLCYPLNDTSHLTHSHAQSDSLHAIGNEAVRKMLLKRWRHDLRLDEKIDIGSTMRDTPSDASQRRLTHSPRVTQKRARSPPPIDESDDDDDIPIIHTMSGVVHSTASAPFDLDEGDPVLPMVGAGRTVEVTSNTSARKPSRGDSTEFNTPETHDRLSKYARTGEPRSPKRNPTYYQPVTTQRAHLTDWIQSPENARKRKTIEDGFPGTTLRACPTRAVEEASSEQILSKPPHGSLRAMKNRIYALKDQRRLLEQRELDEIAREAARNNSVTVTKEDRIRLKEEIETLSKQAVRDLLRLISRRVNGLESSPQAEVKEVKLSLDILPADLTKELKLMVLREKGLFALPASDELQKVRSELRDAIREYRRQRGIAEL